MTKALSIAACLLIGLPGLLFAGARLPVPHPYHIVVPSRPIQPGETVLLRLEPEPPPDVWVFWRIIPIEGLQRNWVARRYRAPYVVSPGHPPVAISVGLSKGDWKQTVTTELDLASGSVPGSEDCLGSGQTFSETSGDLDIRSAYCSLEDDPRLIHAVEPDYPQSSLVRGSEATITVHILVCKTGRVLDAYAPSVYRGLPLDVVERDPKLVEAAVNAAKRYEFAPGACAAWVSVGVRFHR